MSQLLCTYITSKKQQCSRKAKKDGLCTQHYNIVHPPVVPIKSTETIKSTPIPSPPSYPPPPAYAPPPPPPKRLQTQELASSSTSSSKSRIPLLPPQMIEAQRKGYQAMEKSRSAKKEKQRQEVSGLGSRFGDFGKQTLSIPDRTLTGDWFEEAFGFVEMVGNESNFKKTQSKLQALFRNGAINEIDAGEFRLVSLKDFVGQKHVTEGLVHLGNLVGDVSKLLIDPHNDNATFQVASQFNCLEMIQESSTPLDGITIYQEDRTQGPICALATPAGTAFRNYLVPIGGHLGQVPEQIDASRELRNYFGQVGSFQNGYLFFTKEEIAHLNSRLQKDSEKVKRLLQVGDHTNLGVFKEGHLFPHHVHYVLCSGLPISYQSSSASSADWGYLSEVILDATYENTLRIAIKNNQQNHVNQPCYLTLVGGGVFGMDTNQIFRAILRACTLVAREGAQLDVKVVHYKQVNESFEFLGKKGMTITGQEEIPPPYPEEF